MAAFERVAEWQIGIDVVAVASSDAFSGEVAAALELVDDLLHSADRDADGVGEVSLAQLGIAIDGDEHMAIVGEERPGWKISFGLRQRHHPMVPISMGMIENVWRARDVDEPRLQKDRGRVTGDNEPSTIGVSSDLCGRRDRAGSTAQGAR